MDEIIDNNKNTSEQGQKQGGKGNVKYIEPYQWKKGQSGNPGGRPKGKSLKRWVQERLAEMDDDEKMEFLKRIDPELIWRMGEGNPKESIQLTEDEDPYENLTDDELNDKLKAITNKITERTAQETGQEESNISYGGDPELSEDGKGSQGS